MKRIVVACEDAGGARALGPVITRSLQRGDDVMLLLGRVAAETLRIDGVADVPPLADAESAQTAVHRALERRPAAVLTASTCWGLRLEAHATMAARQRSLPTFTLIDFPSQLRPRLSFPGTDDLGAMGDHVLAIDQEMRRRLVIAGVPENRVVVTGSPAFDGLWEAESLSPGEGDATHVLFLSQPIAALHGSDGAVPTFLGYTEGMVLDAVARMIAPHGLELRVRPHPREDESMLTKLARELPGRVRVDRTGSLREAIGRAQWVVGMTSIALVEAALLGKTAISVQFDRRGEDPLWTNVSGLTVGVIDREGLAVAVAEALRTARAPRLARSNMEALGWAPGAAGRVLACLDAATSSAQHR